MSVAEVIDGKRKWACAVGDVMDRLREMKTGSARCCVTSPPYFGLRDYAARKTFPTQAQATQWSVESAIEWNEKHGSDRCRYSSGGAAENVQKDGSVRWDGLVGAQSQWSDGTWSSLGNEESPYVFVAHLLEVFREVWRVLADDGTLWLNLGDSYAANRVQSSKVPEDPKPKDLIGVPWLAAFALRTDGWYLRSDIVWCLSGGAWVYARTKKGEAPTMVKDLVRLDPSTVQLWNGTKWTRVLGWGESADTSRRIELVLRSGERIGCTGGHQWPTQRGNVVAREIVVGDVIATCVLPESDGASVPGYMTMDAAWLAGLYLAEGSRSDDNLQLALHADEARWLERIESVARHLGGSMTHSIDGNNLAVRLYGRVMVAMIDSYIGGNTSHDKHLTNAVWRLPNDYVRAIAEGYLDGDGSADEANDRVRLGFTRNYSLERDIRTLAARLGATLTLRTSTSRCNGRAFPSFRGEWRWSRSGHHNERDRGEVVEIRASRARKFWDIAVEDEPHLFALASGVLTHNCKPSPMPESVKDRPTRAHEFVFLMSKSDRYFYDEEAIRERSVMKPQSRLTSRDEHPKGDSGRQSHMRPEGGTSYESRNARDVWTIAPEPCSEAHFATMPPELARRCILAGSERDDVILDPFGGAGTTALVSLQNNRRAIMAELNPTYPEIQGRRMAVFDTDAVSPIVAKSSDFGPLFGGMK